MSTVDDHRQQAQENIALSDSLHQSGQNLDWAVVVLFYAALHYIDAYLLPRDPTDHDERNGYIRDCAFLKEIWKHYRVLAERSQDARYECWDPSDAEVGTYRTQHYDVIESHILARL